MEGGGRALWLALLASAIVVVSLNGAAPVADGGGQQPAGAGPDTNVQCVSMCGTCPTVCSSPPPPPPPSSSEGGGGGSSSSSPQGQNKGGHPSSYYYLFTAGAGRAAGGASASVYALVLVSLVANLQ